MMRRCLTVAAMLLVGVCRLEAQRPAREGESANRARLEEELRRGFARAVRERVGLNEDQMRRLAPLSASHEQQRRQLQANERQTRGALRETIRNYRPSDSTRVSQLLTALVEVQKRRALLLETEQRDLATVMTPLQRARYMALQEQIRRRMEQVRHRRGSGPPGGR